MKYMDKEILESMLNHADSSTLKAGRRVTIINGIYKEKQGVVQNVSHVRNKPLNKDKVRVWLDGYSCIDIFDFDNCDVELIPYKYVQNLGYF